MSEEKNIFYYKLTGEADACKAVADAVKAVNGVVSVSFEEDELKLTLILAEHASEYDVFCALSEIAEDESVEVDYFDVEPTEAIVESVVEEVEEIEEDVNNVKQNSEASTIPDDEKPLKTRFIAQFVEIGISAILLLICQLFSITGNTESFMCLIAFSVVGYEIIWDAVSDIIKKNYFNYNLPLVIVAVVSLFVTSYKEATLITLIFQAVIVVGKVIRAAGIDKLKKRFYYSYKEVKLRDKEEAIFAKDVGIGDALDVAESDVVPFDCTVESGEITVEYSCGKEIKTEVVKVGGAIHGGAVVKSGSAGLIVQKTVEESFAGLLYKTFVENSSKVECRRKKQLSHTVVANITIAIAIAFILPLFFLGKGNTYGDLLVEWGYYSIIFLAVANTVSFTCSSAIGYISAVNQALTLGSFIPSEDVFVALSNANKAIFAGEAIIAGGDKISKIIPAPAYKGKVQGVLKEYSITSYNIIANDELEVILNEKALYVGNYDKTVKRGFDVKRVKADGEVRYAFIGEELLGVLIYERSLKKNVYGAIKELADDGVSTYIIGSDTAFDEISDIASVCKDASGVGSEGSNSFSVNKGGASVNSDVNIEFSGVEGFVGNKAIVIPEGEVKSVAKTVKLAKRFAKACKRSKTLSIVFKAVSLAVAAILLSFTAVNALWVAVLIDAVITVIALVLSALYSKSVC